MTDRNAALHVVLGAGQVGPLLARELLAAGHRVHIVSRTNDPRVPGARWIRGDVTDAAFLTEQLRGASVVYQCANPMRYDRWDELLPPIARAVRRAASRSGARLCVLDNLYMYGAPASGVISEATPMEPQSKKGELRAMLAQELQVAADRGELRLTVGRASDFFGPRAERSAVFGTPFLKQLARGGASYAFGDPDQPHAHAYIPDVARGLFVLGTRAEDFGGTWLLPHAWQGSCNQLAALFSRIAERDTRLWRLPEWLLHVAGLFNGEISGVPEMLYQWRAPFTVDDSRFRTRFGVEPTPVEVAVKETLQSYGLISAESALAA